MAAAAPVDAAATAQNIIEKIQELVAEKGIDFAVGFLSAVAILIVGRWVARLARGGVRKLMRKRNVDETLVLFVSNVLYVLIIAFVFIAAIKKVGVDTTAALAVVGAAGLAIGFALQGSLGNFAAGLMLIIFRPFKVGDFIEAAGAKGTVEEIRIFTTRLKSPDNKIIIVPNAKVTGDNVVNYSAKETRRVDLVIGVSYEDNLDKVRGVIKAVLSEDARILQEPEPTIGLLEMADSSVNFAVRPWVKTADYWGVYFDTLEKLKKRFDSEGITIPFPQRDVHIYEQKEGAA